MVCIALSERYIVLQTSFWYYEFVIIVYYGNKSLNCLLVTGIPVFSESEFSHSHILSIQQASKELRYGLRALLASELISRLTAGKTKSEFRYIAQDQQPLITYY